MNEFAVRRLHSLILTTIKNLTPGDDEFEKGTRFQQIDLRNQSSPNDDPA